MSEKPRDFIGYVVGFVWIALFVWFIFHGIDNHMAMKESTGRNLQWSK